MRKILLFVFNTILLVVAFLVVLDFLYTTTYSNAAPRTKFQYFRSLKNQQVAYLFLGSSRVESTINPAIIIAKTGKSVVNMGFQAAKLSDIYLLLQLVKAYNIKTEKIFIQLDYIYNLENDCSNVLPYQVMPFIRENQYTNEYFERNYASDKWIYYMPFYRYGYFGTKIGFRELFSNIVHKETSVVAQKGFYGLEGTNENSSGALPQKLSNSNLYFTKIKAFASKNKIEVVFFCAPFSNKNKNISYIHKLQVRVPELYNFAQLIQDETMFKDSYHLNNKGATYFTEAFITKVLQ